MTDRSARDALLLFVQRLASRSFLTGAEESAILRLSGNVQEVEIHRDFVHYGEQVDHSCLLIDGLVGRFGQNSDGHRQITCLYIPGDMTDLPSVVCPRSAWGLSALTKTTILHIPHADLRHLAAKHPGVAEALWRDCVVDGSIFAQWVVNVGRRDASTRVAHLLCEMAVRCEKAGIGDRQSFPLAITQNDLADATGMTGVHLNRTLQDLRGRSILVMKAGRVEIPDWDLLVATGDFDEGYMLLDGPAPRISEAA